MKALLIDDEREARRNLSSLLQSYCKSVQIVGEADGVRSGIEKINDLVPDAIFLDIQMQDGTGFDLLASIPERNFQVVFVTAFDEFAIRAFEFNAVDYLLKPIEIDRLIRSVGRLESRKSQELHPGKLSSLLKMIDRRQLDTITLQTQEGHHYIRLENIIRLESDRNYTIFYCQGRDHVIVSETIKRYEELLPTDQFFRPHQSHIIQRKFIKSYLKGAGGSIELSDGFQVPLARRKKDLFFQWIQFGG